MTNAACLTSSIPELYLDFRELLAGCSVEGTPLIRPCARQSLLMIRPFLIDRCRQQPAGGSLLVLAVMAFRMT